MRSASWFISHPFFFCFFFFFFFFFFSCKPCWKCGRMARRRAENPVTESEQSVRNPLDHEAVACSAAANSALHVHACTRAPTHARTVKHRILSRTTLAQLIETPAAQKPSAHTLPHTRNRHGRQRDTTHARPTRATPAGQTREPKRSDFRPTWCVEKWRAKPSWWGFRDKRGKRTASSLATGEFRCLCRMEVARLRQELAEAKQRQADAEKDAEESDRDARALEKKVWKNQAGIPLTLFFPSFGGAAAGSSGNH
jgi:hypothetical protein